MSVLLPASLADLLPHKPPMVLLDCIHMFDAETIRCGSLSHLNPLNPLRQNGQLSIFSGVEYAAQAMALHARLTAEGERDLAQPRKGFLAVANKLQAYVRDLDEFQARILIEVTKISGDVNNAMYRFAIKADTRDLLEGRLIVVMAEPETGPEYSG